MTRIPDNGMSAGAQLFDFVARLSYAFPARRVDTRVTSETIYQPIYPCQAYSRMCGILRFVQNRIPFALALSTYIEKAGSQKAAAKRLGVSPTYLSDIKKGRRDPGDKILTALGFKRVVIYEKATS